MGGTEAGVTLVELLVASAMGIALLGAIGAMVLSSMRTQPEVSKRAQNISTARWILERMTREIRNGVVVDKALSNEVSLRTFVRHNTCGGSGTLSSTQPSIECQVTYSCTTTSCTREETAPEVFGGGTATTIFTGIDDPNVFSYTPAEEPTFVEIALRFPNPSGPGDLTVSDGASLRNATLQN